MQNYCFLNSCQTCDQQRVLQATLAWLLVHMYLDQNKGITVSEQVTVLGSVSMLYIKEHKKQ